MKNPYYYKGANPTVDLIIINPENKILLIKRSEKAEACPGMWAIPGGFINTESKNGEVWKDGFETPEHAALREVQEETNLSLDNPDLTFVGCFEGNGRDPRDNSESWSKSFAFIHVIDKEVYEQQKNKLVGLDDAEDVDWKTIDEINQINLAFDHTEIISSALTKLNKKKKIKP